MAGQKRRALVIIFIMFILEIALGQFGTFLNNPFLAAATTIPYVVFVGGFDTALTIVFYFSARCAHEDFDIAHQLAGLEVEDSPGVEL